jgi:hypothetical protein
VAPAKGNAVALSNLLPSTRVRRRLLGGLAAAALTTGALGLMAGPASAEQKCTGRPDSNVCLAITTNSNQSTYFIHVGIDVHMSRASAQQYIDASGGNPFNARMWGSDTFSDDDLFPVFLTDIGASDESGLSADFDVAVAQFSMDEDDDLFDDVDEVYASINLRSPSGRTFNYRSPTFTQVF